MSQESQEFLKPAETIITFEEDARCALGRGFEKNPELVRELKKIVGAENVELFAEMLPSTERGLPSTDEIKTVYSQIAKRELERIVAEGELDKDISCGHLVEEHEEALRTILEKTEPSIN